MEEVRQGVGELLAEIDVFPSLPVIAAADREGRAPRPVPLLPRPKWMSATWGEDGHGYRDGGGLLDGELYP